jgi:curli biogenesis system outer membrane secretion channel CsgG
MLYRTLILTLALFLVGCVTAPVSLKDVEPGYTAEQMRAAQQAMAPQRLALKRKVAVARLSNETTYGKSLLSNAPVDKMAEKVSDMFVQGLVNSGNYLVFERPDVELLQAESDLSGMDLDLVGVDTLIVGSLTEFGRVTTGKSGFVSSSKKQEATATIDLRLVDVRTGQVLHSITGTGVASTETQNTMGFGAVAGYDGSINDQAIGAAVNAAVGKLDEWMVQAAWTSDILAVEDGLIFISGGVSQGIKGGQHFHVLTKGKEVKSTTTGTVITLPGKQVAEVEVISSFGATELAEGSITQLVSGSITGLAIETLEVREIK